MTPSTAATRQDIYDRIEALIDASLDLGENWLSPEVRGRFHEALAKLRQTWSSFASGPALRDDDCQRVAGVVGEMGDRLFYEDGDSEGAIAAYDFALSLEPRNLLALKGIVAAHLQGEDHQPEKAFPYALRLADVDPGSQQLVMYIRSLIKKR